MIENKLTVKPASNCLSKKPSEKRDVLVVYCVLEIF